MLKRKIEDSLTLWKDSTGHKPLVIMGIRQCGKTFRVQSHRTWPHAYSIIEQLRNWGNDFRPRMEEILKETLKVKDEALKAKDDLIQAKTDLIEALKAQSPSK